MALECCLKMIPILRKQMKIMSKESKTNQDTHQIGFPKIKRIVNEKALTETREQRCACCSAAGPSDAHHIKSKKSGGHDKRENLLPLCRFCHTEIHKRGLDFMVNKYMHLSKIIKDKGWVTDHLGRWR